MLFVIVAVGEIHPQSHIFIFDKGNKPTGLEKQHFAASRGYF